MKSIQYVKRIGLVSRRKDLTPQQFQAHWLEVHAELCKQLPNLRKYAVNLIRHESSFDIGYDGFSELWFDSEDALKASLASPEGVRLLADLPNFAEATHPLVVIEHRML